MAFAEYDVIIHRDALSVYNFLLDPGHLWREGAQYPCPLRPELEPKGFMVRMTDPFRRRMKAEVGQLERLKPPRRYARRGIDAWLTTLG